MLAREWRFGFVFHLWHFSHRRVRQMPRTVTGTIPVASLFSTAIPCPKSHVKSS
jgi:hypothetical protein